MFLSDAHSLMRRVQMLELDFGNRMMFGIEKTLAPVTMEEHL